MTLRRLAAIALWIALAPPALATAIASTGAGGNWNVTGSWSPAQIPVSGDTVTITSGSPITVPDGYVAVCGTSPATGGTVALTINGTFTVGGGASGQLTVKGPVTHGNALVTFKAGSILEFDSSSNGVQTYAWTCSGFSRGSRMISCTGTANGGDTTGQPTATTLGNHVTLRSNASGGNGYFTGGVGFNDSLWFQATYTDFLRIGDGTNKGISINPQSDTTKNTWDYCSFDACGAAPFTLNSAPGGGGWSITRSVWRNSVGYAGPNSRQSCLKLVNANKTTGTFLVDSCVFDIPPVLPYNGNTYTNNYFKSGFDTTTGTAPWTKFDGNFVHYDSAQCSRSGAPVLKYGGDCTNSYHLIDGRVQAASYTGSAGAVTAAANGSNYGTMTVSGTPWTAHAYESVTVSGTLKIFDIVITAGTGIGQVRGICFNDTGHLQVTLPWDTLPDATSAFSIYPEWANPHALGPETTASIGITGGNLTGNVFDHTGADSNGDMIVNANQPSGVYVIKFNLGLPNAARDNPGTLITLSSGTTNATTQSFSFEHNTWFTGSQNAGALNEGGTPNNAAGQVTSYRGNIAWCEPARTSIYSLTANNVASLGSSPATSPYGPYLLDDTDHATSLPGTSTANIVTAANCDYNGTYGNRAGYALKGYNVNQTTPGAHDVAGDPNFVDRWRNFAKWAVAQGSSGTHVVSQVADGVAFIKANPSLIASSLLPYVRNGFRPQASALHSASYSGDGATTDAAGNVYPGTPDVGAMAYQSPSASPYFFDQFIIRKRRASLEPAPKPGKAFVPAARAGGRPTRLRRAG